MERVRLVLELWERVLCSFLPQSDPIVSFLVDDGLVGQWDVDVALDQLLQVVLVGAGAEVILGLIFVFPGAGGNGPGSPGGEPFDPPVG